MATVNGTTLTYTDLGLTAGTHTVTVTALNAIGESVASNTQSFVVSGAITVPGAPTNVVASGGVNQATITFNAPSNNGGASITSYVVTSAGQAVVTGSSSTTSVLLTGLTPGSYTFTVKAVNSAGAGASSSPSSPITVSSSIVAPNAPTGITATPGTNSATVSFTPPANNGGASITTYTATSSGQATVSASSSNSPIVFTGLTAGNYSFTVTATNSAGTSSASVSSSSITVPGAVVNTVPGAPTGVNATGGTLQAVVNWTAPSNNGGATISSYTVTSSGPTVKTATTGGTSTTVTLTGLTAGTYTFNVYATNSVGNGNTSSSSSSVTVAQNNGITSTNLLPPIVATAAVPAPSGYTNIGPSNAPPTLAIASGVTPAIAGSSVMTMTMPSNGTLGYAYPNPTTSNCAIVNPGTSYTALTYYNPNSSGVSCSAQIQWYTSGLTLISYSKGNVTAVPANTWTMVSVTAAAPTNAAYATIQPTVDIAPSSSVTATSCYEIAASTTVNTWTNPTNPNATVPGAPTGISATGGAGTITVNFTAPTNNGGSPITGYTATAVSQ